MTTNTAKSFHDKWHQNADLVFAETLRNGSDIYTWILSRNGWIDAEALVSFLASKKRVLDAGCGNGRVSALLRVHSDPGATCIMGIDLTAADVAEKNLAQYANVSFQTKDLLGDLSDLGAFDFIYCQEVLHHTEDPQNAFLNLCSCLEDGGAIAIYVYKQKAPVREFVDDYIRKNIADLPYASAMEACREMTEFGRALAELKTTVSIPEVKVLEIPAGEYDVQRLFYHFFCKCFWNPEIDFEQNAVINYDWYHPQLCSRHTLDEVLMWFASAQLHVTHQHVDHYGITVHGKKGK